MLELARSMVFPFERDQTYTIGALRSFESALSAARQADKALSEEWRVPSTPEMRRWGKIREETYPIKLLADHKDYSDDATFRLMPSGFPAIDAKLSSSHDQFALQITIADPIWSDEGAKIKRGGYDNRLLMEGLNRQGVVHGSGGFRRDGDKIVCDDLVKGGSDGADACRRGIVAALARKYKPSVHPATRLLIYTRAHTMQVVDEGYGNVVADAVKELEASQGGQTMPFASLYFVEEREFVEL
jgi:hypothetical protein